MNATSVLMISVSCGSVRIRNFRCRTIERRKWKAAANRTTKADENRCGTVVTVMINPIAERASDSFGYFIISQLRD
jgi:hypothetical protein